MRTLLEVELQPDSGEVGGVRSSLGELSGLVSEEQLWALRLLVTELLTNSIRHAALTDEDLILLRVLTPEGAIRVEVEDPGRGFGAPAVREPDMQQGGGLGLHLLDKMADRWGVESQPGQSPATLVWFEVELQQNSPTGST